MPASDTQSRNPEPKVSEAVWDLAGKWNADPMGVQYRIRLAELIQSELSELLEAGRKLHNVYSSAYPTEAEFSPSLREFAAILSKWEPK